MLFNSCPYDAPTGIVLTPVFEIVLRAGAARPPLRSHGCTTGYMFGWVGIWDDLTSPNDPSFISITAMKIAYGKLGWRKTVAGIRRA
jgi:hypothetical protein